MWSAQITHLTWTSCSFTFPCLYTFTAWEKLNWEKSLCSGSFLSEWTSPLTGKASKNRTGLICAQPPTLTKASASIFFRKGQYITTDLAWAALKTGHSGWLSKNKFQLYLLRLWTTGDWCRTIFTGTLGIPVLRELWFTNQLKRKGWQAKTWKILSRLFMIKFQNRSRKHIRNILRLINNNNFSFQILL